MANGTTLTEWLSQTKKISKSVDYMCMACVDSIIEAIDFIDKKTINDNDDFFRPICKYYHKDNPTDLIKKRPRAKKPCKAMSDFAKAWIRRCRILQDDIESQWFEIIDFFFEKPHLVNPHSIDEYTAGMISQVCRGNKKKNPLKSAVRKKFGKYYRSNDGAWKRERRKRF